MRNPFRVVDDRVVDLCASFVGWLAVRRGVGKYAFLVQALTGAVVGLIVFVASFLLRGVGLDDGMFVVLFAGMIALSTGSAALDCRRLDRASERPGEAERDLVRSSDLRRLFMPIRFIYVGLAAYMTSVAFDGLAHGFAEFLLVAASMTIRAGSEYVRCVPAVPPSRRRSVEVGRLAGSRT